MSDGQSNLPREIDELKAELRFLHQRLTATNNRLDRIAGLLGATGKTEEPGRPQPVVLPSAPPATSAPGPYPPPAVPPPLPPILPVAPPPPVIVEPPPVISIAPSAPLPPPAPPAEPFEVRLGTYWLPRLGMALLLIGMVFLVTWSYKYLPAVGKVLLSYACCAGLGTLGWRLEKRMEQLARVLQAGALALTYFVTYATHYVDAFCVITSPGLALGLLSLVVAGIVFIADRKRSGTLAALALFFGYLTTVISGVATFTLAANAVLAAATLCFLARNRWVTISYGAVFATYLVYTLWVWKLNRFGDIERILFDTAYLADSDFRLRAAFLALYWLLFTLGGLLVNRDALRPAERNGLLTLNNVFFFILFSFLVHHTYPASQWVFQLLFGGALLIASALAYQRFRPERALLDTLFAQGLIVATLGLYNRLTGASLIGALAVESILLLLLARSLQMRWIVWLARLVFGVVVFRAWLALPDWTPALTAGAAFATLAGFAGARLSRHEDRVSLSSLYFAAFATLLALAVVWQHFEVATRPWAWPALAVLIVLGGRLLQTREVTWLGNLPLIWAHLVCHAGYFGIGAPWTAAQSLGLLTVTLGLGLAVWGAARARNNEPAASDALIPYGLATVALIVAVTVHHCPPRGLLAVLAVEALVLLLAGFRLREPVWHWLAVAPLSWAHGTFHVWRGNPAQGYELDQALALVAATLAFGVLAWGRLKTSAENEKWSEAVLWPFALAGLVVAHMATFDFVPKPWWLAVFAAQGALLVIADVPVLVRLAVVPYALGVLQLFLHGPGALTPPWDAGGNAALGWLLLILGARTLRLRALTRPDEVPPRWLRIALVSLATALVVMALKQQVNAPWLTVAWSLAGCVMLGIGFAVRERAYRIAGMTLLGFSLLRIASYDWWKLDTLNRILSFIGLGVILLLLAFLYTRNRDRIAKWL